MGPWNPCLKVFTAPWWRHQMETFSTSPVTSPHKGQWRGALMFSWICASLNSWVNNREVGDLRCHQAHYDGIVMQPSGLEGYRHTGPGGRAFAKLCGMNITATAEWIFSVWSFMELPRPEVVQHYSNLPICPNGLDHGPKTCQIRCHWGPDFMEHISLQALDGFTLLELLWNCLNL